MRLFPIIAAAAIGLFAATAVNAQGRQTGTGNPSGGQNMDTVQKGNPNNPSAGQTTTGMSKSMHRTKKHKRMKRHM